MLKSCHGIKAAQRQGQRGISIVELMVGLTVGLIVVTGAMALFVTNTVNSRRMLTETRLNQARAAFAAGMEDAGAAVKPPNAGDELKVLTVRISVLVG